MAKAAKKAADPRLPYKYTEEGMAEAEIQRRRKGVPAPSGIEINSRNPQAELDERVARNAAAQPDYDRQLEARQAAVDGDLETWEAPDPMLELTRQHAKPGMVNRFLSPGTIQKRGMRGFSEVKDEKGGTVRLGNLILAEMPVEKNEARKRHYAAKTASNLADVGQAFAATAEKAARDSEGTVRLLRQDEAIVGRAHDGEGHTREAETTAGIRVQRGNFVGER